MIVVSGSKTKIASRTSKESHMFRTTILALAMIIPGAAFAQDFRSSIDLTVRPTGKVSFEVFGTQSSQDKSYWCAASEYVKKRLGNPARTRITVVAAKGSLPSGKRNVGFTIAADAAKGQASSTSISVRNVGTNISLGLAEQFCEDLRTQERGIR